MRQSIQALAVLAAMASPAGPLRAQDSPALAQLRPIVADTNHQHAVVSAAQQSASWTNDHCSTGRFSVPALEAVFQRPQFDAQGLPVAGAWSEAVVVEGCGKVRHLNVAVLVRAPGALQEMVLLPGSTRANPILQRDAVMYAYLQAGRTSPDCKQRYIADTRYLESGRIPGSGQPWDEDWTVVVCGKSFVVPMHFVPDATGATITSGPARPATGG